MAARGGFQSRNDGRHWLPSQGVDPAPLAELNAECLGLLAVTAAEADGSTELPELLTTLHEQWADLPAHAVRRLAAAPFSLFDAGIALAPGFLELRARAVQDQQRRTEPRFFEIAAARSITRRMLVYGWHLSRSRPRAACLVFGVTSYAVESMAACSLTVLEAAAERHADALRPRWSKQFGFWRELLAAASAGDDKRMHELLLGGIQRLAAESLVAHAGDANPNITVR
jgi:hypothetical protein